MNQKLETLTKREREVLGPFVTGEFSKVLAYRIESVPTRYRNICKGFTPNRVRLGGRQRHLWQCELLLSEGGMAIACDLLRM